MVIISESKRPKFRPYGSRQLYYAMTYVVVTLLVLVFLNIYCSGISQRLFYQNKQSAMLEKAQLTAKEIEAQDVLNPATAAAALDKIGDLNVSRLVVTNAQGSIVYDSQGTAPGSAYALLPQIVRALDCRDVFTWEYSDGTMQSHVATPIVTYDKVSGCVYMMENDPEQGKLIQSLQQDIFIITLILEIGLLIFSIVYATRFSRRLREIMTSMRIIQDGDFSHKVTVRGHDELSFLGQEFNYLTDRLQTSENKRRQFVSDASHELKTPLASIKLLSDSILQNDMDMQTVREFVSDIGDEADRLNRMTLKLLELTKGQNNAGEVDAQIIYLTPTIKRVVKMLSTIAQENQITIEMDLQNDSPILIHEDDLYQITFNLVENGIKYNTPGGKLTISLHRQEEMTILRVTDTGVGIPPEAISHVFERFYRVDKARSRQSGGSGLGLAIVRAMVERNNGEISLQSTLGKGTTFTVEFPTFDTEVDAE